MIFGSVKCKLKPCSCIGPCFSPERNKIKKFKGSQEWSRGVQVGSRPKTQCLPGSLPSHPRLGWLCQRRVAAAPARAAGSPPPPPPPAADSGFPAAATAADGGR